MRNRVGKKVPQKTLEQWVAELERLERLIAPYGVTLTQAERRRRLRMRPGGEQELRVVGDLAESVGLSLPATVAGMRRDAQTREDLEPVIDALESLEALIEDTLVQAEHEAWSAATAYYTALQRVGAMDPKVQHKVRDLERFFALGPRRRTSEEAPVEPRRPDEEVLGTA